MEWLRKLKAVLQRRGLREDDDFGRISFVPDTDDSQIGIWQMHDDWDHPNEFARVGCCSIPGTPDGPDSEARRFLLGKRKELAALWTLCADVLEGERTRWPPLRAKGPLTGSFVLTSIGLDEPITDPPTWSVGFESKGKFWVYVEVHLTGDKITSHSCDT
jgi:hypothetical protein